MARKSYREPFPWVLTLLLMLTAYLFWVWPRQVGSVPVKVDYVSPKAVK